MELNNNNDNNSDHVNNLQTLPLELWQFIATYLDEIEKIKFGIAVLGFENLIGCPKSIFQVLKRTTNETSVAKQRIYLYKLWYEALNCFSVEFEKFWGEDPTCVFCHHTIWTHLEMDGRLLRVDPDLYQDSMTKVIQIGRIVENLFIVPNEYEEFGDIRYKFTFLNRTGFSNWRGSITLSKSCRHCKIRVSRAYDNYCTTCNEGGGGIFCGCGLFYCFSETEYDLYGLCIDCKAMCCRRCANICDNKCQQVCLRCVNECPVCHSGELCKAHYDLPHKHRHCMKERKNVPEYGQPAAKK